MVYGSCIGAATVVLAIAAVARVMDVTSVDELRHKAKQEGPEAAEAFRERLRPIGDWIKA